MNILVVLRPVHDPAGFTANRKAQKIFVNREGHILNPSDRNVLEAALALAGTGGEVISVALGGEPATETLRMARATGAGRGICIAADSALDPLGVTSILQHLINYLGGVDLVLLGAEVLRLRTRPRWAHGWRRRSTGHMPTMPTRPPHWPTTG